MKKFSLIVVCLTLGICCSGQTMLDGNCYEYHSTYYLGDYIKICFYGDSTFFYQRHQNDVLTDTYSKGAWTQKSNILSLKSFEPEFHTGQIVQSGNPLTDTLFIKIVDFNNGKPVPYINIAIIDSLQKIIASSQVDSLGATKIFLAIGSKYLKGSRFMNYRPFEIKIDSLEYDYLLIKLDIYAMIFEDISGMTFKKKGKRKLVEEYKKGKFIEYNIVK